jgi:predicted NUDIX family NTP pyrophosphohydrolase
MVAGSILPVALHQGKLHFLFGKENPMEDSSKGFSDFGGKMDEGETPFTAALREGSEELTGFFGDKDELGKMIKKCGGVKTITIGTYHVHIFIIDYDKNLPKYFNLNHQYLWDNMDNKYLNDSKLFEKIEIQWFTPEMIKTRKTEFRNFYQAIVSTLLKDKTILEFAKKNTKLNKSTNNKSKKNKH